MTAPAVSVCLRVFNGEPHLGAAIRSILDQTYGDFELIVVDDGSTDDGPATIRSFSDPRIVHVAQENRGLSAATKRAISLARGAYIAIMDADDVSEPDRLRRQVTAFEGDPALVAVGSNVLIVDERGTAVGRRTYPASDRAIRKALPAYNPFAHPTMMFRASALRACGSYSTRFATVEDYELYFRLRAFGTFANIEADLVRYRVHGRSVKSGRTKLQLRETIALRRLARTAYGLQCGTREQLTDAAQRLLLLLPAPAIVSLFKLAYYRRAH